MKICETCKGLGSVADEKLPGSTVRCKACGGTGRAPVVARGDLETPPVVKKTKQNAEE